MVEKNGCRIKSGMTKGGGNNKRKRIDSCLPRLAMLGAKGFFGVTKNPAMTLWVRMWGLVPWQGWHFFWGSECCFFCWGVV